VLGNTPAPRLTPIGDTSLPNTGDGGGDGNGLLGGLLGALLVGGGLVAAAAGLRMRGRS
jgi:hypothetical protein